MSGYLYRPDTGQHTVPEKMASKTVIRSIRQAKTSKFMIYNATNRLEWKLNLTMKWFCAVATQNCSISKHARYHCCIASWPTTNHNIKPDETVNFPNKMHLLQEIFLEILFLSAVSAVLKQLAGFLSQTIKRTNQSCVGKVCLTILISSYITIHYRGSIA